MTSVVYSCRSLVLIGQFKGQSFRGTIFALQAFWPGHLGADNINVVHSIGRLLDQSSQLMFLVKDGDLISLIQHMIQARGRDTVRVSKVKDHSTDEDC